MGLLKYWYVQHMHSLLKSSCLTLHAKGLRIRLIFLISPGCIALTNLEVRAKIKDKLEHELVSSSGFMHGNEVMVRNTKLP